MVCHLFYLIFFISFLNYGYCQVANKPFKVAVLVSDNPEIDRYVGYKIVGAAAYVGWQKAQNDNILVDYDFQPEFILSSCNVPLEAGFMVEAANKGYKFVFGPACSPSALIVGTIGTVTEVPMFLWGSTLDQDIMNNDLYPYVLTTTMTSYTTALYAHIFFDYFKWNTIAVFIYATRSTLTPRCVPFIDNFEQIVEYSNSTIVYKRSFSRIDVTSFRSAIKVMSQVSRVGLVCFEDKNAKRNFLIALKEEGIGDEYVFVMIENTRRGFSQMWLDSESPSDGKDAIALEGAKKVFVMDVEHFNNSNELFALMDENFREKMGCDDCGDPTNSTSNAAELADAVYGAAYLYQKAVNDGITDPKGPDIVDRAPGLFFVGYSGDVWLNINLTRMPVFQLYSFTGTTDPIIVLEIFDSPHTYSVDIKINMTVPQKDMFYRYGGVIPLNEPACGYNRENCPAPVFEQYIGAILGSIGAGILIILGIIIAIFYVYRTKQLEENRLNLLWQVNFSSLTIPAHKSNHAQSSRSLQSTITTSTKLTIDSKKDTNNHAFYLLGKEPVAARKHMYSRYQVKKSVYVELRKMRQLDHENLCKFLGLCLDGPQLLTIWKYCSRGSLQDIIAKGAVQMDGFFKFSIIKDVSDAVDFMHHSSFGPHGWLSSTTCLVDDRWKVKVSFYGLQEIKMEETRHSEGLLWTAPEHIRDPTMYPTTEGDIYSFAIICSEVMTKKSAWDLENQDYDADDLMFKIKKGGHDPIRPNLDTDEDHNSSLLLLIRDCWAEEPRQRPSSTQIKTLIKSLNRTKTSNLMDHAFNVLEQYASNLEDEVQARMKELTEEKKKSDILLYRMLPKQVADKLKLGQTVEPEDFENVTLFFSDVVSFTTLASRCTPLQVVNLLNDLYTTFDAIIDDYDVYKVETIGDGYLCVSGLPRRNGNEHAKEIAEMSISLLRAIKNFRIPHLPKERIQIRVGLHTGSVVTGVVGITMPRYCLFGDAVNTASRMESNGKPGRIHISTETMLFLTNVIGGYETEPRGEVIIKGKGAVNTHWLLTKDDFTD